jgi:hypothetical protein
MGTYLRSVKQQSKCIFLSLDLPSRKICSYLIILADAYRKSTENFGHALTICTESGEYGFPESFCRPNHNNQDGTEMHYNREKELWVNDYEVRPIVK